MQKREQSNLFLTLDALVSLDHPYRKLDRLLPGGFKNQLQQLMFSSDFSELYIMQELSV